MLSIPAGTFRMGSEAGEADEKPAHTVAVAAFELDVTEVTAAQYAACVGEGACSADQVTQHEWCNYGKNDRRGHPINCVDWPQAEAFCAWAHKRLPTEEEWEYAARGSDGRKYPWGNKAPDSQLCWSRSDGTCEVGGFPEGASPFGVLDLAGNVWEWTASSLCSYPNHQCTDHPRVLRGGGWVESRASSVRATYRSGGAPESRAVFLGFRCAR